MRACVYGRDWGGVGVRNGSKRRYRKTYCFSAYVWADEKKREDDIKFSMVIWTAAAGWGRAGRLPLMLP